MRSTDRTIIATLLICSPGVSIADEPVTAARNTHRATMRQVAATIQIADAGSGKSVPLVVEPLRPDQVIQAGPPIQLWFARDCVIHSRRHGCFLPSLSRVLTAPDAASRAVPTDPAPCGCHKQPLATH